MQGTQHAQRLGGEGVHGYMGCAGNRSILAFLAHRMSGKKQWDRMLTEFQRTPIICEGGRKALLQKWCKFFLSFPVISIFPLGPNRIKIYTFYRLNGLFFFFSKRT